MHSQYCATTTSVWLQNILIASEGNSISLPVPLLPSLWLLLISFLSFWIYLFQTLHVNGIISTRPSCLASFTQLSIFRVHLCCGMNVVLRSFFLVKSIPLYDIFITCCLFILQLMMGGFYLLAGTEPAFLTLYCHSGILMEKTEAWDKREIYAEKDTEKRIPRMKGGRGELDMESSRKGQWERRNRCVEGGCRGRGGGDESAELWRTWVIPLVRESSGNKGSFTMAMGVRISHHQLLKCFELDMQWGGLAETLLARGAADPIPLLCQLGSDCKGCMGSVKST